MKKKSAIAALALAIVIALFVAVGAAIAATVTRTRYTDFTFTFGELTAQPSLPQTQTANFTKSGDSVTFDISMNNPDGQQFSYALSVSGNVSDGSVKLSQFLCYIGEGASDEPEWRFVGTLASLSSTSAQPVFESYMLDGTNGAEKVAALRVEYHNTGAPSQRGEVAVTVSCTASSLDTNRYTVIDSIDGGEELLYTFRAAKAGLIQGRRTLILTADSDMSPADGTSAEEFAFAPYTYVDEGGQTVSAYPQFEIDLRGFDLNFGGSTFKNADISIYSSASVTDGEGNIVKPTVSSLTVGEGSFVDFSDDVTLADSVSAEGFDGQKAAEAIGNYLVQNFEGAYLSSAEKPLGNLTIYAPGVVAEKFDNDENGNVLQITYNGRIYRAYLADGIGGFGTMLSNIMTAQNVRTENQESWNYATDHVGYDLYLPTTLYEDGGNAQVVWDSDKPAVLSARGNYFPDYCAQTVQLTAAVSAYGNTSYFTFYVRAAGRTFEERMQYMCSQISSLTLADTNSHILVYKSLIDSFGQYGLTDFAAASASSSIALGEDENGNITVSAVNGNSEQASVTFTGTFSEDGLMAAAEGTEIPVGYDRVDPPTCTTTVKIDVAAIDPENVLDMVQAEAAEINVLQNILKDDFHELHSGDYACGEGSFTLPGTYPLNSVVGADPVLGETEAQYLIGYELSDGNGNFTLSQPLNDSAAEVKGDYELVVGGTQTANLVFGNIINIKPEYFEAHPTSICLEISLYSTSGTPVSLSEQAYGDKLYLEFVLPAALTEGDNAGFVSNHKDENGIDYIFAAARDKVNDVAPIVCESHLLEDRKFILLYSINLANTAEEPLIKLDLSAPAGVTGYEVSSIYGLTQFTKLTNLNLSGSHIGDDCAMTITSGTGENSKEIPVKNMDIIAGRSTLEVLNLEHCDMTTIVSFKSLTNLENVNLAGNGMLRNISALLFSSATIEILDICDTLAAEKDVIWHDEANPVWHDHSVLEEMFDDFVAAHPAQTEGGQPQKPTYYIADYQDTNDKTKHDTANHVEYNPRTFDPENSDDVVEQIAKNYAYRFENIIEMTNVIHLQNTVIVAGGEPYDSINWAINNVTDANGAEMKDYATSSNDFSAALVLDLTPGRFRLTRGYTIEESTNNEESTNKIIYNTAATGCVVDLKMTITVAGRSYERHFYISVLESFAVDNGGQSESGT